MMSDKPIGRWIKRTADIVISAMALIVFAPVMLLVAGAIRIRMGSPVIFVQKRPGLNGQAFSLYKFRTMMLATHVNGRALTTAERTGRLGKLLRKLSLDELPQLWNVFRGDMSLIGPRPLLMEYLDRYSPEQMRRHDVRPGITGLAQVSGRNNLEWARRFELDVWYVDNWSLWLDLRIVLMTFRKVFSGEGVAVPGLTKFQGESSVDRQESRD